MYYALELPRNFYVLNQLAVNEWVDGHNPFLGEDDNDIVWTENQKSIYILFRRKIDATAFRLAFKI